MTNGTAPGTNGIASLLPCPYCGCEMRVEAYTYLGLWYRVVPAENHGERCFLRGVQHRRFSLEAEAIETWNTRVAVTDHDFAMAVHDGELWGKCSECERIAELERELEALQVVNWWTDEYGDTHAIAANGQEVCHYVRGEHAEAFAMELCKRDELIRDLWAAITWMHGMSDAKRDELRRRIREFGTEVDDE